MAVVNRLRFLAALWTVKAVLIAKRVLKRRASDIPGRIAVHIDPLFIRHIGKPRRVVAVTGTNGKTSVSNLLTDALTLNGYTVVNNRQGYNTRPGIALALAQSATIFGRQKDELAVLELDEESAIHTLPFLDADFLVCTNLTRDSLARNGHPRYVAGVLDAAIGGSTTLILNADDLICARIGGDNRRVFFGVGPQPTDTPNPHGAAIDAMVCPVCATLLTWDYWRYNHIGHAHCPSCGFSSPDPDFKAINWRSEAGAGPSVALSSRAGSDTPESPATSSHPDDETLTYSMPTGERHTVHLLSSDIAQVYNQIAIVAALSELGLNSEQIRRGFESISIPTYRAASTVVDGVTVQRQMLKGLVGPASSRALAYVASMPGEKVVLINIDDLQHCDDVEDTCWLYDTDAEYLADEHIHQIAVGGKRRYDHALRLAIAGVDPSRVLTSAVEAETIEMVDLTGIDRIVNMHDVNNADVCGDLIQARAIERVTTHELRPRVHAHASHVSATAGTGSGLGSPSGKPGNPDSTDSTSPHPDNTDTTSPHPDNTDTTSPHPDNTGTTSPHPDNPDTTSPHPDNTNPIPANAYSIADTTSPVAVATSPAATATSPVADTASPAAPTPGDTHPISAHTHPAADNIGRTSDNTIRISDNTGTAPTPTGTTPTATGTTPTPTGTTPTPTGTTSTPGGAQ